MKQIFIFSKTPTNPNNQSAEYTMYMYVKQLGINVILIDKSFTTIYKDKIGYKVYSSPLEKFVYINENDVFIIRRPALSTNNAKHVSRYINNIKNILNLSFYNPIDLLGFTNDKYQNYMFFKELNIPTPKTIYIPKVNLATTDSRLLHFAEQIKYPLILKSLTGSLGNDVLKVFNDEQLKSIAEILYRKTGPFIMQENIDSNYDVRIFTVGDEVIGGERRNRAGIDFRTNVSKGAAVERYDPTKKELIYIQSMITSLQTKFGDSIFTIGFDFIKDSNDNTHCLEINGSPGVKGISEVLGFNVANNAIDYVLRKEGFIQNI